MEKNLTETRGEVGRVGSTIRVWIAGACAVAMAAALTVLSTGAAVAGQIQYKVTDAVKMRTEPRAAASFNGVAPRGSAIDVVCQQWGEAQGPNGNTLWLNVNGSGRSGWWVSDAWTTSPHKAADKTVGIAGVPMCTGGQQPPPQGDTPVWIGSPVDGFWTSSDFCPARYPNAGCSLPTTHHTSYLGTNAWSVDLQVTNGTPVFLFAAPKQPALDGRIFAKVEEAGPACKSGRLSDGGSRVRIGLYLDKTTLIGQVVYSHIEVDPAIKGQVGKFLSSRWDVRLGTVGSYRKSSCWTGVHHHVEVVSVRSFACFNGAYSAQPGANKSTAMQRSNYIGYIGGTFPGPRAACPSNV